MGCQPASLAGAPPPQDREVKSPDCGPGLPSFPDCCASSCLVLVSSTRQVHKGRDDTHSAPWRAHPRGASQPSCQIKHVARFQAWKPRVREVGSSAQGHTLGRGRCPICTQAGVAPTQAQHPWPHQGSGCRGLPTSPHGLDLSPTGGRKGSRPQAWLLSVSPAAPTLPLSIMPSLCSGVLNLHPCQALSSVMGLRPGE